MSAFPPQRSVASIPVSQEIACKYLSAYLSAAQSSPHLLPNARLEPSGPTAGSSNSSITIHNLQRVEAGLRGEWLAPTLDLEEGKDVVPIADGMDDGTNKQQGNEAGDWMDLDQYQREQSIEGGTIAEGVVDSGEMDSDLEVDNHVEEGDEEPGVKFGYGEGRAHVVKTPKQQAAAKISTKPLDKAVRKAEKEQRKKQDKKEREERRTAEKKSKQATE